MKRLFHFILSHSIFIAFCAAALSLQTLQLLFLSISWYLLAFIFFATLCGYNAYWMVSRFTFNGHTRLIPFLHKCQSSLVVVLAAITGMIYCMAHLHLVMYNTIVVFILLSLYAIPVMPFKRLHFLRKAGFFKTIVLAFAWTIVTILIPLQIPIFDMGRTVLLVFLNRFLFMLMLCIIFDKRDAAVDKIRGLQSLATSINPLLLHIFFGLIFIAYSWITYAMIANQIILAQVTALLIIGLITIAVYAASLRKKEYLFYYFVVDGLMFLSALFTALAGLHGVNGIN